MRDEWADLNRAWWDERAPIHATSDFYDLAGFLADPDATTLRPFEIDEVGEVAGRTLVHPQCHFGMDTLSWARRGARVVGLDFSGAAVAAAAEAAGRAGLDAEFVVGNVYDAVGLVGGRTFDIVYTGLGAINWLPDIERWADVMAALTAPGGLFYVAEFHPVHAILGDDDLTVRYPYFHDRESPLTFDEAGTYADLDAATGHNHTVEWTHGLGSVVSAVIDAGLTVELLHEFDYTLFPRWPFLVKDGRDIYRLPDDLPSIPLMYSLRARKPA
ncbi:MAG TPA: class I SAM-dependent methyltransferase [Acidimicrobiales bacterium]